MNRLHPSLICLGLLLASLNAHAQPSDGLHCPELPADSQLQWDQQQRDGYVLCRAIAQDGGDAFSLMLTRQEPSLRLARGLRAERASFAEQPIHWYRMDLANDSDELAQFRRITVSKLGKQQYAQLWFNANNQAEVATRIEQIGHLRLHNTLLGNR